MNTYIVLLRGINVAGKNKLPMQDLRTVLSNLGYTNVQTYIQSGNAIITTNEPIKNINFAIKKAIKEVFNYEITVIVKTLAALKKAVKNYPFNIDNEKIVGFVFLDSVVTEKEIAITNFKEDSYVIAADVVYIHCMTGFGKTKLTNNVFEKKLNVNATTRNLKTTLKLIALATINE